MEFRLEVVVIVSPELLRSSGMSSSLVPLCNSRSFVIDLNYGYRYLLDLYSELSNVYFVIWLCYRSMLALCYRPVLVMVNILALEL